LPRAELWAKVSEGCPELVERAASTELAGELRELHEEIVAGLKESTASTVWQRLRDAGRLTCSITTFRRYLYREVREVDPQLACMECTQSLSSQLSSSVGAVYA
jgi:hypothetical protein